ncbi:sensor histidine kinase [Paenibacillus sp. alder61]|uniref:histidine kinase n=1 Tax=Paenibacillus faecis TaxID=862114 RepID=A0A5D0CWI3_9BACL|nr:MULTISPECIES: sensor histidine kinase [Paenibacillus]MCA1291975.1 sensor histidine kinase [Paenibacillus sp. alder61]TYA13554.1 sensor histidine kinase [Paenibacillus faecis]
MMPFFRRFARLKFRTKLIVYYVLLITLPMILISYAYYRTSSDIILKNASDSMREVVKKNNQYNDIVLNRIKDQSLSLLADPDLFRLFDRPRPTDLLELLRMDREVSEILNKYYASEPGIGSVQLVTSYYSFGGMASSTSRPTFVSVRPEKLHASGVYQQAARADGRLIWVPTYDFAKQFDQQELADMDPGYRYVFSAAQLLKSSIVQNGVVHSWGERTENPLLLINFNESFFRSSQVSGSAIEGATMYVVSERGDIVAHPDGGKIARTEAADWLKAAVRTGTGTLVSRVNGEKVLICYDTSEITGWLSVLVVPYGRLISDLPLIHTYSLYIAAVLIGVSVAVAYMISGRLTKPIKKLLVAIQLTGSGVFSTKIPEQDDVEFGILIRKFNQMNEKISDLIDENYKTQLREKEAEIMALNLQLNPHFLYNTLNVINWMALERNETAISQMLVSLSTMLQYTVKNKQELVSFGDDLIWLKSYLHIMEMRYFGVFETRYELDEIPLDCRVPKMFLQPVVENAIIHGFSSVSNGGLLRIAGRDAGDRLEFIVEDNGRGMEAEALESLWRPEAAGVGLKNVNNRIKLLYGESYGMQAFSIPGGGTRMKITLPKQSGMERLPEPGKEVMRRLGER